MNDLAEPHKVASPYKRRSVARLEGVHHDYA